MPKIAAYKVGIKKGPLSALRYYKKTIVIYREAISFIAKVIIKEWDDIYPMDTNRDREHYIESLIHETKYNTSPAYGLFDKLFYKFPSYLRRSAIGEAIGLVSSYKSNLALYEKQRHLAISNGMHFKKKAPTLQTVTKKFPCFFRKSMSNRIDDTHMAIKVFNGHDWVWITLALKPSDVKYIQRHMMDLESLSPSLMYANKTYKLLFPFKKTGSLPKEKPLQKRRILAVDLGINTQATCTVMDGLGTILGRRFIQLPKEIDRMHHLLNRLKKIQQQSGKAKPKKLWQHINGYKKALTDQTVHGIIDYAKKMAVDVIVLENLSPKMSKAAKSRRDKMHHWNKRTIIKKVCQKAHFVGIRYSLVNPKNTSKLAFDGSGPVKRNPNNYAIAIFQTGKVYNADLSATYNIAARYFIRAYEKTTLATSWSELQAKVPELQKRTYCTLATFRRLLKASSVTKTA